MKLHRNPVNFRQGVVLTVFLSLIFGLLTFSGCDKKEVADSQDEYLTNKATNQTEALQSAINIDTNNSEVNQKLGLSASPNSSNQLTTNPWKKPITTLALEPIEIASKLDSPVNDFASILSRTETEALDSKIRKIYDEGLLQIGVVIVPTTNGVPIFDYAMSIAEKWALGTPENSNGIFILVAVNDREMYILTGSDVEDELKDEIVSRIIREEITPYFREGSYADGISSGIDALVRDFRQYQKN